MAECAVRRAWVGVVGGCAIALAGLLWLGVVRSAASETQATQTIREVLRDLGDASVAERVSVEGCGGTEVCLSTSQDLLEKLGAGREVPGQHGIVTWYYDEPGLAFRLRRAPRSTASPDGEGREVRLVDAVRITSPKGGRIGSVSVGSGRDEIDQELPLPFQRRRAAGWGIELHYLDGGLVFGLDPHGDIVQWIEIRRPLQMMGWARSDWEPRPQVTYHIAYGEEPPSRPELNAAAALHTLFSYTTTFRHEWTSRPADFSIELSDAGVETSRDFWIDTYHRRANEDLDRAREQATVRNRYSATARVRLAAYDHEGRRVAACGVSAGAAIYSPVSRKDRHGEERQDPQPDRSLEGIAAAGAAASLAAEVRHGDGEIAQFVEALRETFPTRAPVLSLDREKGEAVVALDPDAYLVTRFHEIRVQLVTLVLGPRESGAPFADRLVQWAPVESELTFIERTEDGRSRWQVDGDEWLALAPDPASGFLWAEVR